MILNIDCSARYRVNREKIRVALIKLLDNQKIDQEVEINVSIVGERKIKQVLDGKIHDVLSFPLDFDKTYPDGIVRLGDIVVCYPEAVREAAEWGRPIDDTVAALVEHGGLHLLGIHHE